MNLETEQIFFADDSWKNEHRGAHAGILVMRGIENVAASDAVDRVVAAIEADLREKYAGYSREDFNAIPAIQAYNDYYKKFGKTYHVRPQVEAVVGGKCVPRISGLLSIMFAMELKNLLLTAGHDLDALDLPVTVQSAVGGEEYVSINGKNKTVEAGDMMMRDSSGIISSIIHGPDERTKMTKDTKNALFAVYAPAGIEQEAILSHLKDIQNAISLFSPEAITELLHVFEA